MLKNKKLHWNLLLAVICLCLCVIVSCQIFIFPRFGNPGWTCLILIVLLIVNLGIIISFHNDNLQIENNSEISELDRQTLTQQMLQTQAQMASLQSQINPHFLYNTLESIRSKALIHDENEIADMVEALAHIFRYNIGKGDVSATLTQELNNVQNYMTIQNYRFRNKFHLEVDLGEDDGFADQYTIPVLTLQPIVENAIHYGLEKKIGEGHIFIRGYLTQRNFILEVRDDGVGMTQEEVESIMNKLHRPSLEAEPESSNKSHHGTGIALPNVDKRLKLFFGNNYGLEIMSAQSVGTQISIIMPRDPVQL